MGDADGAGDVAGDIEAGTTHVEQAIHGHDEADVLHRHADGFEHHGQHNHARAGDAGGADGGQGGGDHHHHHLADAQGHTGAGGQEDCGHALVDGGAVHVDGGAQGQDEGGDVLVGAHLIGALLGDGERRGRGGGGEGEDHGREGLLEELQGADLAEGLGGDGVDHHGVDDVADVGAQEYQRQRAQDFRALGGDDPGHVGEHADGRQGDDEHHELLDDGVSGAHEVAAELCLLAGGQDGAAEEQGNDDDLEHVGRGECRPHVAGEDADQGGHKAAELTGGVVLTGAVEDGEEACAQEDVGHHQADDAGDGGGYQEIEDGFHAHGADLLHVVHGDDAVDHGQEHHRHDDELQKVHEDVAKGLEIVGGEVLPLGKVAHKTDHNAQDQGDQDLQG